MKKTIFFALLFLTCNLFASRDSMVVPSYRPIKIIPFSHTPWTFDVRGLSDITLNTSQDYLSVYDSSALAWKKIKVNTFISASGFGSGATVGNANATGDTLTNNFQKIILDLNHGSTSTRNAGTTTARTTVNGSNVIQSNAVTSTGTTCSPDIASGSHFRHTWTGGSLDVENCLNLSAAYFGAGVRLTLRNNSAGALIVNFDTRYLSGAGGYLSPLSVGANDSIAIDFRVEYRSGNYVLVNMGQLTNPSYTSAYGELYNSASSPINFAGTTLDSVTANLALGDTALFTQVGSSLKYISATTQKFRVTVTATASFGESANTISAELHKNNAAVTGIAAQNYFASTSQNYQIVMTGIVSLAQNDRIVPLFAPSAHTGTDTLTFTNYNVSISRL